MGSLQADIGELAHHLKQERLFLEAEKQQIQILNEKVVKTIERVYQASWVRGEQQRNYDDLVLRPHSSPPACCQRANLLNQLKFIDGYKVLGFNESLYGDLLSSLRDNPRLVAKCLVLGENQNQEAMQVAAGTMFSSVYGNCLLPDDETLVLNLLKHLMELQLAVSETPRRLLRRGSCAFSQIYRSYVDTLPQAKVFLTAALHQPVMQLLMEDELFLDIDPAKAAVRFPPEERLRRFGQEGTPEYTAALAKYRAWTIAKLVKIANRFMESIKEAMNCFPPQLSWLVRVLYDVLLTAKRADTREVSAICVDLVFALFLCPALISPEPHGICDAPISHISRFNLIQVAQILQVLAMSRWETPDSRLSDLYSNFDKEVISGVVDSIVEGGGSEAPPPGISCLNSPLSTLVRSSILIPEPRLHSLVSFLFSILGELPDDDITRKELEAAIGRLKPSHITPPPTASQPGVPTASLATPKKNLLGRVKSNRNRSSKSASEGSGDSDSLGSAQDSTTSSSQLPAQGSIDEGEVMPASLDYDTVLVISLNVSSPPECPGLMSEEKVLSTLQVSGPPLQATKPTSRVRMNVEDDADGGGGEATIEKRTRFSLSHDEGSIGNTSDNLEAISEAASNHSVASSLDDVEQEDQPDNLSDMVSANVSGRGTPNVSGRDTPSSQVTEGEEVGLRGGAENQPPAANIPVTVPKPARADIEEKFGRFEIKPLIGGDETVSLVSDTWSTDVLASDSETIEAADRADRGDQFHDQLLNRHLAELDRMQGDYLSGDAAGETFETASEAWSTDVLASDSERMTEFDTDDAQSVARSDDTGRSEVEVELGGSDLLRPEPLNQQEDNITPRAQGSRSPVEGAFGGSSSSGILKPMPVLPPSLGLESGTSTPSGILKPIPIIQNRAGRPATPPRVEFQPIRHAEDIDRPESEEPEGEMSQTDQEIASATQSLGRLSLNLSTLPNNGIVSGDQHLLLNTFIGESSRTVTTAPLIDLGSSGESSHMVAPVVVHPHHKLVSSDRGSGEDSSLHLSTTSLASSSSSGSDVVGGSGKIRSASNASSGPTTDSVDTPEPVAPPVSMAATGAIPKSISFDKTAERGDRDSMEGDAKHKRGFFKNFKLPGFKGRRKPGTRSGDDSSFMRAGMAGQEINMRRTLSEDNRPPTIEETSDDILAKYRKKPEVDTSETDGISGVEHNLQVNDIPKTEEDERLFIDPNNIESSYAFTDAKRKLRLVLSIADFSMSPYLPEFGAPTGSDGTSLDSDVLTWLRCQLAEATNLHDRSLVAQLHETIRCVQLFDTQGRERLVRSLTEDYRSRSPYVAYLVRSRQGLLTTIAHLDKLLARIDADAEVVMASIVGVCVRMFLERREHNLSRFTHEFTVLTVPDEKVQLVENFLSQLYNELERDPMWISSTNDQLNAARLALERVVMSHIYIHALYPNGDGDVSRDQVLHEHMKKLSAVITPAHKDLRIPKLYQYECPWPSAQAEIICISAYKTAGDKLQCVVRASQTIMNLLSLAHEQSVPAADDFMPVLVYVLIKANPPALLSTAQYVNLFFEQRLKGEDQYWWTQFCAAIEFIKTMDYTL
ncbi:GTPase-activating protein and VPS9 domain-containing protein 1-like isoform X1 [Penaeus chinensis]|uniref:GTPase-activating protein and VPS9 domain-containing protein 1-like isoform X1 n=2 Tax=Penaeus chinensis TaxID=139456 RepID=UPI001FB6C12F|nr:GTPase-activating protein and VPS9 domain-containing protein 1-like isoform X1 [Penaeus chinensis]